MLFRARSAFLVVRPRRSSSAASTAMIATVVPSPTSVPVRDVEAGDARRPARYRRCRLELDGERDPRTRSWTRRTRTRPSLPLSGRSSPRRRQHPVDIWRPAASRFRLRRERHQQVTFLAAAQLRPLRGAVPAPVGTTTAENLQARLRYDLFFADNWSFFLGAQARRDRFQGLDLRAQIDPGVAYYFIDSEEDQRVDRSRLRLPPRHPLREQSLGEPLQPDRRPSRQTSASPSSFAPGGSKLVTTLAPPISRTNTQHSGRAFLGYTDAFNDGVSFALGLEFIQSFTDSKAFRFNGDALLTAKLSRKFALVTGLSVRYDNEPVEGKLPLDTLTTVSLSYTVL